MPLLASFLGKNRSKGLGKHHDIIESLKKLAICLRKNNTEGFSKLGGLPLMPEDLPWPEWKGFPLSFLCQLDLSEIPSDVSHLGLPASGLLYFFYDQEQSTWGFDPNDKGSWRVLYVECTADKCALRNRPSGLNEDSVFGEKFIGFSVVDTFPDWQDERIEALDLSDNDSDAYAELCVSMYDDEPTHHLFGYPNPVQGNDMNLECQLASNGIYCGDATGYNNERAAALESGKKDWLLLLQLDTDDDLDMMWGDCGLLYFWIKGSDLEKRKFDDCWMILQCS